MLGVEATDGEDFALEFDCGIGLGRNWARRSGWSLSTTDLRGLLILIDLLFGVGGNVGLRDGVDMAVVVWRLTAAALSSAHHGGEMVELATEGGVLVAY